MIPRSGAVASCHSSRQGPLLHRISHGRLAACVTLLSCLVTAAGTAPACKVETSGVNWCTGQVTYSFLGSQWNNVLNGGAIMKIEVYNAVQNINLALQMAGTAISFVEASSGGQVSLQFGSVPGTGIASFTGSTPPDCGAGCNVYGSGTVVFRSDVFLTLSSAYSRQSVALHELLHALGLGHATGCPSSHVMFDEIAPGEVKVDIDAETLDALDCIYGNPLYATCGSYLRFVARWVSRLGGGAILTRGMCNGCGCLPQELKALVDSYTYELAISEAGGAFQTVATLAESDWTENEYVLATPVPYSQAILRLRVLDGASLISESQTWEPVDIAPDLTGVEPAVLDGLGVESWPNPFTAGARLSFSLPAPKVVEIAVYDLAGRRIARLRPGSLGQGQNTVIWDGRRDDGAAAASGVYYAVVLAEELRGAVRIAKLR